MCQKRNITNLKYDKSVIFTVGHTLTKKYVFIQVNNKFEPLELKGLQRMSKNVNQ